MPFLVIGPFLRSGYILSYDMIFSPHAQVSFKAAHEGLSLYSALLVQLFVKMMSLLLPMDWVQKLILYTIFFLAVYGMYRSLPLCSRLARLVGGLFYAINPFVYDRLMAGHWIFLLAYSLTPFVLLQFYRLFTRYDRRSLITVISLWSFVAALSPHHLLILGLLFAGLALLFVRSRRAVVYALIAAGGTLALSSWWLLPLALTPNFTHSFGLGDFYTFASKPDTTYGIWLNLISLQGFWYTAWHSLRDMGAWWPLFVAFWLTPVCAGLGVSARWRSAPSSRLVWSLALVGWAALFLAAGPNAEVGPLNTWLFGHVPGLIGLRESHKLLALLALFYAVATAFALDALSQQKKRWLTALGVLVTVSMILCSSWWLLWGAQGQLRPVHYPAEWEAFYRYLDSRPASERVLVLPYELYLNKTFAHRLVANPALAYYDERLILSTDPKLPGLRLYSTPQTLPIDAAIARRDPRLLEHVLHCEGVRFVMFIGSDDIANYQWAYDIHHTTTIQSKDLVIIMLTTP